MTKFGEVRGFMEVEYEGHPHIEEVDDEFAEFFGLYIRDEDGLMMWDSDHNSREEAEEIAEGKGITLW